MSQRPGSQERSTYIPSLDGLRCVAIVPVFVSHVLQIAGVTNVAPGNFGVTLFFFLSGYLITTLMRLEMERTGSLNLRLFYMRRVLRIFPTCYLVLAAAGVYGLMAGTTEPWWLFGQAIHLTNYQIIAAGWQAPIAPYTDVYWSLAVEEHFYIAFPLLFLCLAKRVSRHGLATILVCVCGAVFLWRCTLAFVLEAPHDRTYLGTDTRIDSILFGCALAVWGNPAVDPTRVAERVWKRVLLPLSVAAILVTFAFSRTYRETFAYSLQGLCLFAVFVTAVRYPGWGPMRILNWAPVRWLGAMSYAIYLVHLSMIAIASAVVGKSLVVLLPTAAGLTVLCAALLYHGIEVPVGRLRKKISVLGRLESSQK